MSEIRSLTPADIPAVAAMYRTMLERRPTPAPPALEAYLRELFLDGPLAGRETPSLVLVENGELSGFMGVLAQTFVHKGSNVRAAIGSSLMVRDYERDPLAGVRLMKAFLVGPQDVSLTETAGGPSLAIWRQLGGVLMDDHSLDWVRVLRPARFGVSMLSRRLKPARLLGPVADLLDRKAVKKGPPGQHLQWLGLAEDFRPGRQLDVTPVTIDALPALIESFAGGYEVKPVWTAAEMAAVMAELPFKPQFGDMHAAAVRTSSGAAVGGFIYYLDQGRQARVVQILARRGQEGVVIDTLLGDAASKGAVAVEGRITPQTSHALMARRCFFLHRSASAVHSRSPELVEAFVQGRGMFNGLIGEYWSRLYGGSFDAAVMGDSKIQSVNPSAKTQLVDAA